MIRIKKKEEKPEEQKRELITSENVTVTTTNSFITAKNLAKLSLKARKLLYLAMSQCVRKDQEFYFYEITATEFADLMGIYPQHVYQEAKGICKELIAAYIEIIPPGENDFEMYSLFSKCSYDGTKIRFKLNSDMTTALLNLTGSFSKPLLHDFMKMKSVYSMALWHLMQREMKSRKPEMGNRIEFDLSLEELRKVTGTEEKKGYDLIGHFKSRILDKAVKEINDCCMIRLSYTDIKRSRSIVGFHFIAENLVGMPKMTENLMKRKRRAELIRKQIDSGLTEAEYNELQTLIVELDQMQLNLNIEN